VILRTVEWIFEHINELFLVPICVFCLIKGIQIVKNKEPYLTFYQNLQVKFLRKTGGEEKAEKERERLLVWNKKMGIGYIYIFGSGITLIMIVLSLFRGNL